MARDRVLAAAIAFSTAAHAAALPAFGLLSSWRSPPELDLTVPITFGTRAELGLPGGPRRAPAKRASRLPAPARATAKPAPTEPTAPPAEKLRDAPAAAPASLADASLGNAGGASASAGGVAVAVVVPPALVNAEEVLRAMRAAYPIEERRAGREGRVIVELHVSDAGLVTQAEIVHSGGPAFDRAALEVARRLRFSPARDARGPVAVKMRQPIDFRLED